MFTHQLGPHGPAPITSGRVPGSVPRVAPSPNGPAVQALASAPTKSTRHDRLLGTRASSSALSLVPPQSGPRLDSSRAAIRQLLTRVSPERFERDVKTLATFGSRNINGLRGVAGSGNAKAVKWLDAQFRALGYNVRRQDYAQHAFGPESNVIAEKRGTTKPDEVVVVIAHLDDVGHVGAGADDNASGVAAMLEMARALKDIDSERTIRFVAANGEEGFGWGDDAHPPHRPNPKLGGLRGSIAYVNDQKTQGTLDQIKFVIAMDMVGYNPGNNIMGIETDEAFRDVADWYAKQVRTFTNLKPNLVIPAWGSDHMPFLRQGIPTVLTIEHWDTKTPCYHRSCDTPDTLNVPYAAEIIRLNLAVMAQKAGTDVQSIVQKPAAQLSTLHSSTSSSNRK